MTAENRPGVPGNQGGQPDERSLVVRSEQTDIDSLSRSPYLVEAGFSPRFPQLLMRLNDVLPHQSMSRLSLELHPGSTPKIDASVHFRGAYKFFVDAIPSEKKIEIALVGSGRKFRIDDIKDFSRAILPDKTAVLHAEASPHLIEPRDDFNEDLQAVSEDILQTWFEELPAHESAGRSIRGRFHDNPYKLTKIEVRIEGQKYPLFCLDLLKVWYDDIVGCEISNFYDEMNPAFYYSGKPQDAEKVIEELAKLFDKPPHYP